MCNEVFRPKIYIFIVLGDVKVLPFIFRLLVDKKKERVITDYLCNLN